MSFKRRQDTTTLLPKSLRDQIESKEQESHSQQSFRHGKTSRKQQRILNKTVKKERKTAYFAHRLKRKGFVDDAAQNDQPPPKRRKIHGDEFKEVQNKQKNVSKVSSKGKEGSKPDKKVHQTVISSKSKTSIKANSMVPPSQVDIDEDREIAWLEYKLGISQKEKGKSLDRILQKDGLDDLLDGLDDLFMEQSESEEDGLGEENEIGYDEGSEMESNTEEGDGDEIEDEDEDEDVKELATTAEKVFEAPSDDDAKSDETGTSSDKMPNPPESLKATNYVPPHLRQASSDEQARRMRVLRQLKGLMNKLSESNLATVLSSVEDIYRQHPRNDITTCLTSVVIESISSNASLLDNHISLNAAFVACLYRAIGIEFAAYFVQEIVTAYDNVYQMTEERTTQIGEDPIGKESLNVIVCIAELYNFEVISYVLMYDIIRQLITKNMGELEVELLLKVLRISGRQLRQDDPLALKDIVQLVSDNLSSRKGNLSSRTRFMVETLTNLKNNRIKKADASGVESMERLKKFISGLSKRYAGREPLRVTLKDLRSADTKGKWWLVGSAWAGDPLVEAKQESISETRIPEHGSSDQQRLLALAKKQGMNTDIRRSIFVVLMSSDDYFDACERLSHLKLNEQQQREIIRVLLHCCGTERAYNPYYSLVGQKLCEQSYSYRVTAQYCLWDFLRELGEQGVGGAEMIKTHDTHLDFATSSVSKERVRNIAKLYGWWISRESVTLTVLKPIDFLRVKPETQGFLDTMFRDIFVNSQVHAPLLSSTGLASLWVRNDHRKEPLEKLALQATHHGALAQGLLLYFSKLTKRCASKMKPGESKFFTWAAGTVKEALETGISLVPSNDMNTDDLVL
ncbi:suppressor of glycerol defect [Serendipita sp. 398]|nr:suppressor of glycerol defect [Serendipita sp. 398]